MDFSYSEGVGAPINAVPTSVHTAPGGVGGQSIHAERPVVSAAMHSQSIMLQGLQHMQAQLDRLAASDQGNSLQAQALRRQLNSHRPMPMHHADNFDFQDQEYAFGERGWDQSVFRNDQTVERQGGTKRPFQDEDAQPLQGAQNPTNKAPRMSWPGPAESDIVSTAAAGPAGGGDPVQPAGGRLNPDLKNDAVRYLNKVKSRYEHDKDVFKEFLSIMKLFHARKVDTPGVIQKVSALFVGEAELILGFQHFLPDN